MVDNDPRIDCHVGEGTGDGMTNDLWLINIGEKILEHDLKIRWSIPSTGQHGAFLLPKDIAVGEQKVIRDFLVDTENGAECRIEIID